jgi:hypothetical protein
MIDISKLTESDINRKVVYIAHEGAKPEEGRITSFTQTAVFVDFQNVGRGQNTPPNKLNFLHESNFDCYSRMARKRT